MSKELEKDFVEVTPDGHQEIVEGNEPLKKKPKKEKVEKTAYERWQELKKHLNNQEAFMDLAIAEGDSEDDSENEEGAQPPDESAQAGSEQPDEEQAVSEQSGVSQETTGEEDQAEDASEEEISPEEAEANLIEALRAEGHSDAEINYIIHGHGVSMPDKDEHAANNEKLSGELDRQAAMQDMEMKRKIAEQESALNIEHKKRMADLEYEKAKADMPDPNLEKEHKKRMLDLEYEQAKANIKPAEDKTHEIEHQKKLMELEYKKALAEMQLELEYKEKELEFKLKQLEQNAKAKSEQEKVKHEQKLKESKMAAKESAQKPDPKKPSKPLKKSEDEEDDSEDVEKEEDGYVDESVEKDELPYWHPKAQLANQKRVREMDRAAAKPKVNTSVKPVNTPTADKVPGTYNMPTARGSGKKYGEL